jgi:hypothetical protein
MMLGVQTMAARIAQAQQVQVSPSYQLPTMPSLSGLAKGQTRVIPSISISEGYDSNPWFGSTPPGSRKVDYFTNVIPAVSVLHQGRLIQGNFNAQAIAGFYVNNPEINYLATYGQMNLRFDQLVQKLDRRLSLSATDVFFYTPVPPGFINPVAGQDAFFSKTVFGAGLQAYRVNSTINTGVIQAGYLLTPRVSLQTSYTNTYISFGDISGDPTLGFAFGFVTHSISAGPSFKVSPRDTIGIEYNFMTATFSGGGEGGSFSTHGATVAWTRILAPKLVATLSGGVQILAPGTVQTALVQPTSAEPTSLQQGGDIFYTTSATLVWNYRKDTAVTLSYSRFLSPGFFIASGPLVGHFAVASIRHDLTPKLTASGNLNYAIYDDPTGILNFTSYGADLTLAYTLTRNLTATANYSYYNFSQQFSGQQVIFDRNMLLVGLTASWN